MRNVVFVTYDICEDKRLREVYRFLRGRGDHIQYSVFRCVLSKCERAELIAGLAELIQHGVDQVLLIDAGPTDGRGATSVESIGRPFVTLTRRVVIV